MRGTPVQAASASPTVTTTVAAARAECARLRVKEGPVTLAELEPLVAISSSSPEAAEDLCYTIVKICGPGNNSLEANRVTCGAAGAIPAILSFLSNYGAVNTMFASRGCYALAWLAFGNTINADVIVLSAGGLEVIFSLMIAHASDVLVQQWACWALFTVAEAATPGVFTAVSANRAVELIHTAKRAHAGEAVTTSLLYKFTDIALNRLQVIVTAT